MSSVSNDLGIQLYQSIAEENDERVFEHWHASSISECPRAHYYMRLGIPGLTKPSGAKVIRWGAGHKLEEELRKHIDKVWGGTTSNVRLTSTAFDVTGEYDNLTKDGSTLIEVKSVSDWAFYTKDGHKCLKEATGEKTARGYAVYGPKPEPYLHHQLQNHVYALLLGEQKVKVKEIHYVYASLSGLLCVYKTKVNPKYLEWIKARIALLNGAWERQEPPECKCGEKSELYGTTYQWCNYRTTPAPSDIPDEDCCSVRLLNKFKEERGEGESVGRDSVQE